MLSPDAQAYIRRHYPDQGPLEIARRLGVKRSAVIYYAKRQRLLDQPGARERLRQRILREGRERMKAIHDLGCERMARVIRIERSRAIAGEPQRTARRFTFRPRKFYVYRHMLIRRKGYIADPHGDCTRLYYDQHTIRRNGRPYLGLDQEQSAHRIHGLTFHPVTELPPADRPKRQAMQNEQAPPDTQQAAPPQQPCQQQHHPTK